MNKTDFVTESLQTDASEADEILEGEYTEEVMGAEVPVPDDLLDEGVGSPRYPLPDDLVRYKYKPVAVQSVPQSLSLTDRIVVAIPVRGAGTPQTELGVYESVAATMEKDFPLRTSRLRALYAAMTIAEERKIALMTQRELEREAINWRNSVNNRQIDIDLASLRTSWESARAAYHQELRSTQDALIAYRMVRQTEIESARRSFWEVRERCAKHRDEQQAALNALAEEAAAQQAALDRAARDRAIEMDAKTIEEREEQRRLLREMAVASELAAQEAEEAACEAEDSAITGRNELNIVAWENYQRLLSETHDRIESDGEALRTTAEEIERNLLEERRSREAWLHEVHNDMFAESQDREKQLHHAQLQAASAVARAGLSPGDAESGHRTALKNQLTEELVADGTASSHLAMDEPSRSQHILEAIALGVLGCVFGASLGLLTGVVDLTPEGLRRGGALGLLPLFICGILGIFVYYLMGLLARRIAAYASEEFHASPGGRAYAAASAVVVVLVGMIGMEAYVERYGIVQSVIARQLEDTGTVILSPEMRIAYWAIALVFAAPFIIYHAYEGTSNTRRILAIRRRRAALVSRQYEAASDPSMAAVTETQEVLRTVRKRRDAVSEDFLRGREEAERRIGEIDQILQDHPAILRWREYAAARDVMLEEDRLLRQAKSDWDDARNAHQTDPSAAAARVRASKARATAEDARRRADQAESLLLRSLEEAARGIIASTGTGLAQAIGDQATGGLEVAAGSVQSAILAISPVSGAAAHVQSLVQQANAASSRKDLETREESMARERWDSLRNAISHDPQIKFYQSRISSLKTAVHGADTQYGKRRKQLLDQKRAIELRIASSEESNRTSRYFDRAIDEEELNALASKMAFEDEWQRLVELAESPGFARWYIAWMQRRASRLALRRQVLAVQNVKLLSGRGVVDAS